MSTCWCLACPGYPSDPGFLGDRQIIKSPHYSYGFGRYRKRCRNRNRRNRWCFPLLQHLLTCRSSNNSFQLPLVAATQEDRQKSRKDKRADTADETPAQRTVFKNPGGFLHSAIVPVHCDEANSGQAQQHSQDDDNQLRKTASLEAAPPPAAFCVCVCVLGLLTHLKCCDVVW